MPKTICHAVTDNRSLRLSTGIFLNTMTLMAHEIPAPSASRLLVTSVDPSQSSSTSTSPNENQAGGRPLPTAQPVRQERPAEHDDPKRHRVTEHRALARGADVERPRDQADEAGRLKEAEEDRLARRAAASTVRRRPRARQTAAPRRRLRAAPRNPSGLRTASRLSSRPSCSPRAKRARRARATGRPSSCGRSRTEQEVFIGPLLYLLRSRRRDRRGLPMACAATYRAVFAAEKDQCQ